MYRSLREKRLAVCADSGYSEDGWSRYLDRPVQPSGSGAHPDRLKKLQGFLPGGHLKEPSLYLPLEYFLPLLAAWRVQESCVLHRQVGFLLVWWLVRL